MHPLKAFRTAALATAGAATGLAALVAIRSYVRESREFFPPRNETVLEDGAPGLPGAENVSFRNQQGLLLRGWWMPSANGAGVILLHGAGGDRMALLPEARILASRGFGVLLFDWPGHGQSEGAIHWSDGEASALVAATDFVVRRADIDATRMGALGFSLGGVVLARVAAAERRLSAVVLVGTPSDQAKQIAWENRQWGPLSQIPAVWAVQSGGMLIYDDQPRDLISAIAPRPVLIVNGTDDATVPAFLAQELFRAAREPKDLLLVEGGGHGRLEQVPGSPYLDRITTFFERTLLDNRGQTRGSS